MKNLVMKAYFNQKNNIYLCFLIFMITNFSTLAQDSIPINCLSKNNVYWGIGLNIMNPLNLNNSLKANNLQQIHLVDVPLTLGLDLFKYRSGMSVDGSIMAGLLQSKSKMWSINGRCGYSYLFLENKNGFVYVNVNYSYLVVRSKIVNNESNIISVSNLSASNGGIVALTNSSQNIGVAFCFGFLINKKTTILKFGYDYSLTNNQWNVINSTIQDFPKEKFNRYYVLLSISLKKMKA